jgi:hypothetical protein
MSEKILIFILLALFLFGTVGAATQDKSYITVIGNDLNNGVIVLDILREGKAYWLTCNREMPGCSSLKDGRYQMVELPRDFAMYECKDAEIYSEFAVDPEKDRRLGEYCLEQK